jgi:hypothetical protein
MNEDIRQQVILALGVEGQENADLILQAIYKVKEEQEKLVASLGQQGVETQKVVAEITKLAGVLGSLSTIYNGLTGATQYLKDAEAAEAQAAREATEAEKLLAEQLKNDSTNARKVAAQAAKDEAQILRTEMAQAAREAAAERRALAQADKDYAAFLKTEVIQAEREAAQAARDAARAQKEYGQQFDAQLQSFVTSTLATHQSEEALRSRARATDAAVRSEQALVQAVDLMAQHEATAKVAIDATAEARNRSAGSADEAGRRAMALTRTIYFAAQGFEDLQYGFNSFVNNIPLITMSAAQAMGKSTEAAMAWGAGLSILGVVINSALIPALKGIVDRSPALTAFFHELNVQLNPFRVETYGDRISKLGEHLKELEGKKIKLSVDISDLERTRKELQEAKKDKEAFDDAMSKRTKEEREAGKAVEEALAEAPAGEPEITARITAQLAQQGRAESPELREKREQLAKLKAYRATLDPNALVDRTKIEEADRQIAQAIDESLTIQTAISENAKGQAGHMLRMAKEGRTPDVERLLPFLRGFEKAPDIGIGPVAGDLSKQVETAADRARFQVEMDRDIPALKKTADERRKAREETERIAEGARQKAVADKDKAEAETERIAEGARQKAVTDAEKAAKTRQTAIEKQARALEGHKGGLAEQLTPAILARMARGQDVETIIAGLAPQVAGRVGRIPTVPAGMAPDISRQIVQDVLAKQGAPMAGEMAFAPNAQLAAMGLQAQGAAKAMEGAQRQGLRAQRVGRAAMQQAEAAALSNETGMAPQVALNVVQATHKLMAQGFSQQRALAMAWQQQAHHLQQLQQQVNHFQNQMMQMQTRQQPQRGHHWPGFFGGF